MVQQKKVLASKDQSNFKEALKLFESKQYKKGLKICDQILKKNAGHGETLSVRGLIKYHMNQKEEGREDLKNGLAIDSDSFICWNAYAIYSKLEKNYEEAAKAFAKASQKDPQNINVARDLAVLQMHTHQYAAASVSRGKVLELQAGYRTNWNGLASAQFLAGDYKAAENTLSKFEKALNQPLPKTDLENTEMTLFKNVAIYKTGDVERALKDLEEISDKVCDFLSVMEYRAKYLLELGRKKEAEREYRALIKRNPDNREYFAKLEECLEIDPTNVKLRNVLYTRLAQKYPTSDAARAIPLGFLTGEDFEKAVSAYLKLKLEKGVPSTFLLLKAFYKDQEKRAIIEKAILAFDKTDPEGETKLWSTFYLAQHYDYLQKFDLAFEAIEKCFVLSPEKYFVELSLAKAKILKHVGNAVEAANVLKKAQESNLSDRFINSKTGKYLFRANLIDEGIKTISLFTHNDASNTGIQDLHDMQTIYQLIELAEAYKRVGNTGLALKRYEDIYSVFSTIHSDHFDFHNYCMHKGVARSYVDVLDFVDQLYTHPTYTRAARGAVDLYIQVLEQQKRKKLDEEKAQQELEALPEDERKRILKKQKKDRIKELKKEQEEKERQAAAAKNADSPTAEPASKRPVVDKDPFGKAILESSDPVAEGFRYWKPLSEQVPNSLATWEIGFEVYLHQGKYVLALQAISPKGNSCGASESWLVTRVARIKHAVQTQADVPPAIKMIVERTLPKIYADIEETKNLQELIDSKGLDSSVKSIFDWATATVEISGAQAGLPLIEKVFSENLLALDSADPYDGVAALKLLQKLESSQVDELTKKFQAKWTKATVF